MKATADAWAGLVRLGPAFLAALLAAGVLAGVMAWPTTEADMVRVHVPSE